MKSLPDYADQRHKAWCIHCGAVLAEATTNRDHVPSKSLLERPYPAELPTVEICVSCNSSFSLDEEYFVAFLGSVLSGTADPSGQMSEKAEAALSGNRRLQEHIESSLQIVEDEHGNPRVSFIPDLDRIRKVVVKNARGHVIFEHGRPADGEPANVAIVPLEHLNDEARRIFETIDYGPGWPEVGSRLMSRLASGDDMRSDGWVVVQPDVYRFAVMDQGDRFVVRTVIREYLATEVIWDQ